MTIDRDDSAAEPDLSTVGSSMSDVEPSAVLIAASEPWVFTQQDPLSTSEFCQEAAKRRVSLREEQLPDLWRVGALAPFIEIRSRPLHPGSPPKLGEAVVGGSWRVRELQRAVESGRLADPVQLGFRPQLRFHRPDAAHRNNRSWWNGLLYSRWQLLGLYDLRHLPSQGKWKRRPDENLGTWRSRTLDAWETAIAERSRQLVALLVALEARYLPVLERGWLHIRNATNEQWDTFVQHFDPAAALATLNRDPADLLRSADILLFGARRCDPLGHNWSELMRRAPQRTLDDLSGDALVALDHRIAAEILLLCYEDLAARGAVAPLTERYDLFHTERERISYRPRSLDTNLSRLGLSPHPGVILVVEGETEEDFVPLVRDRIPIPGQAEVIQSVVLRGIRRDLTKLAAFASAPLLGEKMPPQNQGEAWVTVKPPTRLMVVVDPDAPYDSPENVEAQRRLIVEEIIAVVRAQGVEPNPDDIDSLVSVKTWSESCFEFAHFTDDELAEALLHVHPHCDGWDKARLVAALRAQRDHGWDIKNAWKNWGSPEPSKKALARELWPVLRSKLDAAASDPTADLPPIAEALISAFREAVQRPHGLFVIRGTEIVR
jgi:hypothetical protein